MFKWELEFNKNLRVPCNILEVAEQKVVIIGDMPFTIGEGKYDFYIVGTDKINGFQIKLGTASTDVTLSAGKSFAFFSDIPKGLNIFEKLGYSGECVC